MKNITETALVTSYDYNVFYQDLNKFIAEMQGKGLEVEIQYQPCKLNNSVMFSALLIGSWES